MHREHTVKSFDEILRAVEQDIQRMGRIALSQMSDVIEALRDADRAKAQKTIADDERMDELDERVAGEVQRILALRQPLAEDLRGVISCDRIARDLERVGDHLKNISRRLMIIWDGGGRVPTGGVLDLAESVGTLLDQAVHALERGDAAAAEEVYHRDASLDRAYEQLARILTGAMSHEPGAAPAYMELMFIAKALERVGDHATNISEHVVFWVTGERLAKRPT